MENHLPPRPAAPRRGGLGRAARAAGLGIWLAVSPLASCTVPAAYTTQFQNPVKTAASARALGLRRGASTWNGTLGALRKMGVTNIATARGLDAKDQKATIDAVSGDYMGEVLLFRNGVFHSALSIGADGNENTGMYLHIVHTEGVNAVAVVSSEMSRQGYPSVFVLLEREPPKRYFISHGMFPGAETGINDPLMVGDDLSGTGVTFVWRDFRGFPAENGVILKCDGKGLAVTKIGMQKLLGCECLWQWYNGNHKNTQ